MIRRNEIENLDDPNVSDQLAKRAYRDIAAIHSWLGDVRLLVRMIRRDPLPVRRILDVGCGTGLVLHKTACALGVEAIGADIHPRPRIAAPVAIVRADACRDPLPRADVAYCMNLGHHLEVGDLVRLIRNVGRSSRRFIIFDLVRRPLPLALFRIFVAPLICAIDAQDGRRSIQRSYTPQELREIVACALAGSGARFRSSVGPFCIRQVIDISYGPGDPVETQGLNIPEEDACLH